LDVSKGRWAASRGTGRPASRVLVQAEEAWRAIIKSNRPRILVPILCQLTQRFMLCSGQKQPKLMQKHERQESEEYRFLQ
jgi:hypothetical protein